MSENKLKVAHDQLKALQGVASKNFEEGAQVNKIEAITVDGVVQIVKNKTAALNLSNYAKKTDLNALAKKSELGIFSTVPSTVEGAIWFDFENHAPVLKLFYSGEEFTFASKDTQPEGGQTYHFSSGAANYVENYTSDDIIILGTGLEIFDANFVERNEFADLLLTFTDGSTATIGSTTAAALENLSVNGRSIFIIDAKERRHTLRFYPDGRIVEGNAVTVTSDFSGNEFTATNYTTVASAKSPITLAGGTNPTSLKGGANSDTITGNSGNDTFTGGAGSNTFGVRITGDNVITDFDPSKDQIATRGGIMEDLRGANLSGGNLTLEFNSGSLTLLDFSGGTVTIDSQPYNFGNGAIFNAEGTAVTLLAAATIDCGSDALYANVQSVNAANGGSIKAHDSGVTLTGSAATFVGGDGADNFTFTGGNITIQSYEAADCVSLAPDFTLTGYTNDETRKQTTLLVNDSSGDGGTIVLDTLDADTAVTLWQNGQSSTHNFAKFAEFNNDDPARATSVTLLAQYGDFGVQNEDGSEYYGSLYTIAASQENSTIIGCNNINTIKIIGGTNNVITGGIGGDYFLFNSGGGVITDFGVGVTKDGYDQVLYTRTTQDGFDRFNPVTDPNDNTKRGYAAGIDILQVKGTVKKVAFENYGKADSASNKISTFNATVYYKADADGKTYSIELQNIAKKATTTNSTDVSKQKFQTDEVAAKTLKIWDTSTDGSSMKVLGSTALAKLFSTS